MNSDPSNTFINTGEWYKAHLSFTNRDKLLPWCDEHFEGGYNISLWHIQIEKESDLLLYKLTFPEIY